MFIYVIENLINGKKYVGKTMKTVEERWKTHIRDSKRGTTKLYNAIKKYGVDNFDTYWMECTHRVSNDVLNQRERYWIAVLQPEYNMTAGGDGGPIHSQLGKRWRVRDTTNMRGPHTITDAVRVGWTKTSGAHNYQSVHTILTPWGEFFTWREALAEAGRLYHSGRRDVVRGEKALQQYCKQNIQLSPTGRRTYAGWRGLYTRDIGFSLKPKHD